MMYKEYTSPTKYETCIASLFCDKRYLIKIKDVYFNTREYRFYAVCDIFLTGVDIPKKSAIPIEDFERFKLNIGKKLTPDNYSMPFDEISSIINNEYITNDIVDIEYCLRS